MYFFDAFSVLGNFRYWRLAALLTSIWAIGPVPALAQPTWECLEPALKQELERKLQFQDDFASTAISQRPDFKDIATLAASASKEAFKVRYSQIAWLWENDRGRLSHADAFWSFPWDENDTKEWRLADQSHSAADDLSEDLKRRVREHPDALSYRSFGSEKRSSEPFVSLLTTFGTEIGSYRDRVASCF